MRTYRLYKEVVFQCKDDLKDYEEKSKKAWNKIASAIVLQKEVKKWPYKNAIVYRIPTLYVIA